MNKNNIFRVTENEITITREFYERIFITNSKQRTLSAISLRVAAYLILELSDKEFRPLPPRSIIAKKLETSRTSVINALVQLEQDHFILRENVKIIPMIVGDKEKQKERDELCKKERDDGFKARDYSGKFRLNEFYNFNQQIDMSEDLNHFQIYDLATKDKMAYLNENDDDIHNRLDEFERRLKKIEQILLTD